MPEEEQKPNKPKKVDPSTLPPELKPIYEEMLADYTRKTQAAAKKEEEASRALAEAQERMKALESQVAYYSQMLLPFLEKGAVQEQAAASAAQNAQNPPFEVPVPEKWDPFDPGSVRDYVGRALSSYHNMLLGAYNSLLQGIYNLQAYNYQLLKTALKSPNVDLDKVIELAPKFGGDLEMAARALTESPVKYREAERVPTLEAELAKAQARIKELEARATPKSFLGGTTGPVSRITLRGNAPKNYDEVVSSISPEEIFEVSEPGTVMGTAAVGRQSASVTGGQTGGG